jgi:hypothetical protein
MSSDEIGLNNGDDFWISGLAIPGSKVQKSSAPFQRERPTPARSRMGLATSKQRMADQAGGARATCTVAEERLVARAYFWPSMNSAAAAHWQRDSGYLAGGAAPFRDRYLPCKRH